MRSLLAIVFFVGLFVNIEGQSIINAERISSGSDSLLFNLSASYSGSRGNQQSDIASVSSVLISTGKRHQWKVFGGYSLLSGNGEYINEMAYVHARHNYKISSKWSSLVFGQMQFDQVLLLQQRVVFGLGARGKVLQRDSLTWDVALGPMYELELLNKAALSPGEVIRTSFLRANVVSSFSLEIRSWCKLTEVLYYQPRFRDLNDFRLLSETYLNFQLTDFLGFFTGVNLRYDSKPVLSLQPLDLNFTSGFDWKF